MADDVAFKITGGTETLKRMIQVGKAFTDQSTGGADYRANIHLVADSETGVTVTAEDKHSGITFTRKEDVKVVEEGDILVHAMWIDRALSVLDPNATISISFDSAGKKMVVEELTGDKVIRMSVPPVGANTKYPSVDDPSVDVTMKVDPDSFREVYSTVSVARDLARRVPILMGVLVEPDQEAGLLRFMGNNGQTLSSTDCINASFDGDGEFPRLVLNDDSIRPVFAYTSEAHHISIRHDDKNNMTHFLVYGDAKEKDLQYHIKVAPLNVPVDKFPAAKLRASLTGLVNGVHTTMELDKAELQRILQQAADIGSLDVDKIGGMSKNVNVTVDPQGNSLTASVDTAASYTDSINVQVDSDSTETMDFVIPWGIHSSIIASYHNSDDPSKFQAGIVNSPKGLPVAMVLYKDSLYSVEPEGEGDKGQIAESIIVLSLLAANR